MDPYFVVSKLSGIDSTNQSLGAVLDRPGAEQVSEFSDLAVLDASESALGADSGIHLGIGPAVSATDVAAAMLVSVHG